MKNTSNLPKLRKQFSRLSAQFTRCRDLDKMQVIMDKMCVLSDQIAVLERGEGTVLYDSREVAMADAEAEKIRRTAQI
jgi:hypothetical protein